MGTTSTPLLVVLADWLAGLDVREGQKSV